MKKDTAEKIGIMGGTFDPPHFGHFVIAQTAFEALGLGKVLFIPTGKIVYKDTCGEADGRHRFNMLKSVIDSNPDFELSDTELKRSGTSYTADTLTRLKEGEYKDAELYFLVGADSLDYMDKWYRPEVIFSLCTVAVAERRGFSSDEVENKIKLLNEKFGAKIIRLSMPMIDVSSTMLREMAGEGRSIRYLTHDSVIEYINKHNLYGGG